MAENEVARQVVDAALEVHRIFGPGLFESVYELALAHELRIRSLLVQTQVPVLVRYKDLVVPEAFKADLIVENLVIVEIKSTENMHPLHRKQLLTYLRLTGMRLGLLANFGQPLMKDGIERVVNRLPE